MKTKTNQNPLVGKFFHQIEPNSDDDKFHIGWQGVIIGNPEPGIYMAQLFDWLAGQESAIRLVKIEDMKLWMFYNNADEMNHSYEHGSARMHRSDK